MKYTVVCIGDNHLPFLNKRTFTRIVDEVIPGVSAGHGKRNLIVIDMGDKFDQFSQKKFPGKMLSPRDEFKEAREMAEEMWALIRKRAPRAKCFQLRGNHDVRAYKRLMEKAPELEPFFSDRAAYEFDGVQTIHDPKEALKIDNTIYTHGHRNKLELHLKDFQYLHNVVIGHLHTAKIHFERVGSQKGAIRYAACAGWIGNAFSDALNYRNMNQYFTWTQGVLLIESGWPRFIGLEDE